MKHRLKKIGLIVLISPILFAADLEPSGFLDARYGIRTQSDPNSDQETLNELRLQLGSIWYHDLFTATVRSDFIYDSVNNLSDPIDLREFNILCSPLDWMDLKLGRQILTWGTGDLLFINDLFSKDWKSFFAGRDEEYLKAPSDALFISFFPTLGNIDIAYLPRFAPDRLIDGERFSYWNGTALSGTPLRTDEPNSDEIAARISRNFQGLELSAYGYSGHWKTPQGFDPASGKNTFPKLNVYGTSARRALLGGIANLEAGYYDSSDGVSDQVRLLVGYEHEIAQDLAGAAQYYTEQKCGDEESRHVLTLRLTQMLMNQNLTLCLFTYWSPSDQDGYLRPSATYKLSDHWKLETRGNIFFGKDNDTFFGQFQDNNNLSISARYSF